MTTTSPTTIDFDADEELDEQPPAQPFRPPVIDVPLSYPGDVWIDPDNLDFPIYKDLNRNAESRRAILKAADGNRDIQDDIRERCKRSFIFWLNLFGWTYRVRIVTTDGREVPLNAAKLMHPETGKMVGRPSAHLPFITWPIQDEVGQDLIDCIDNGEDALVDKSRDMGASWMICAVGAYMFLFREHCHIYYTSRTEQLVERSGDPQTLFWKIEYMLERQPYWLKPHIPKGDDRRMTPLPSGAYQMMKSGGRTPYRQRLLFINPQRNNSIAGFAATGHVGRAARGAVVFFDELASMEQAGDAWISAADTAACRVANSTPLGAGTTYSRLYHTGTVSGSPKILELDYRHHPEKGRNGEWRTDEDGSVTQVQGRRYWWSPWLKQQIKRRSDPADLAQNVFHDHETSGRTFFSVRDVIQHKQEFAERSTIMRFEIDPTRHNFKEQHDGRWYLACELSESGKPANQRTNYVMFADPSYGVGAANTAIAVMDSESGRFVAMFVDPLADQHKLAWEMCFAGKHLFGGQVGSAFIGWETNGPGESLYGDILKHEYPFIYHQRPEGNAAAARGKRYGWRSDRRTKRILLAGLNRCIIRREIEIPFVDTLDEMLEYIVNDDGSVGPGLIRDEKSGAREAHGDRVVAAAGCVLLRQEAPAFEPERVEYAKGTMGDIAEHWRLDEPPPGTIREWWE
jgi:hypothetical protein